MNTYLKMAMYTDKIAQGFSLLELLFVISVIGVLSAIGLHGWQTIQQRAQLSSATMQLLAFIKEVQDDANWRNQTNTLHLFIGSKFTPWCLAVTEESRPVSCDTRLRFIQPDPSVEITGFTEISTLAFYGKREMAQTGTIRLENSLGQTRVIVSTRGRIRYCAYNFYLSGFPKC
ncbi:prepilin-type N-terminal cleavage/methylation domain-containing protein [Zophobihabitans entericus]|uniref:Prepilin-type N-terminal cleavage/methylation domain-containing protein n=1 Tax=Zophobihabitans entericus TaxID=1635327 RepID=A0A6G9IBX7_9GAMM|nr:prepilin-type N-terminal cleavage/methylation domain-containing protein [Zophobihabitans entericus]QIQ21713.1 prepilin-type N-terminal cleavage/methylation domain-containing protein [Zophobihabitans entericus]